MKSHLSNLFSSKYFRLFLGLSVSALTLYLAVRNVNYQQVGQAISQADPRWLGSGPGQCGGQQPGQSLPLAGAFWRALAGTARFEAGHVPGLRPDVEHHLPCPGGRFEPHLCRRENGPGESLHPGDHRARKAPRHAFLCPALYPAAPADPAAGLGQRFGGHGRAHRVLIASFAALLFSARPAWLLRWVDRLFGWLPQRIGSYLQARFQSALESLEILKNRPGLVKLVFWSAVVWGTAILNNYLVLLALEIALPWTASLLILMVLQAGISLPSAPGRFGIFEYSCILALAVYGVAQASALSYGHYFARHCFLPGHLIWPAFILAARFGPQEDRG